MNLRRIHLGFAFPVCCAGLILVLGLLAALLPAQQKTPVEKADSILILKKDHLLELFAGGKIIRTYKVALGRGGLAPKQREGDMLTPEGHYVIEAKYVNKYHKGLRISYPNAEDRKRAAKQGVSPGGFVLIHGLPNGQEWIGAAHRLYDWTFGCIAVTDEEVDEIYKLVPIGTPVEIRP